MFILVCVDFDCMDCFIGGVEFVTKTTSREEAQAIIDTRKALWKQEIFAFFNYVDKFMEELSVPDLDRGEWYKYVAKYPVSNWITPDKFKQSLSQYLKSHINQRLDILINYNPPVITVKDHENLFIVEVPNGTL